MKVFDVPWSEVLANLPAWEALEPRLRRAALSNLRAEVAPEVRAALPELIAAGLVERKSGGPRATERWHVTLRVLRGMARAPVWRGTAPAELPAYLDEHFTVEECTQLCGRSAYRNRSLLARHAASSEWLQSFREAAQAGSVAAWEKDRLGWGEVPPRLRDPRLQKELAALVEAVLARGGQVRLSELAGQVPGLDGEALERALVSGLRYLLLFAGLDDEDRPVLGGWPPAVARLLAPAPAAPAPVEVVERFHVALLMEDMAVLLAAIAAEPVRVRMNDGGIFARALKALSPQLLDPPDWAADFFLDPDGRLEVAAIVLRSCRLARFQQDPEPSLAATAAGRQWLASSERERLGSLLDVLRRGGRTGKERTPSWRFLAVGDAEELREPVKDAFRSLPVGQFVWIGDFVPHRVVTGNPFLDPGFRKRTRYTLGLDYTAATPEESEERWQQVLLDFLMARLLVLGGAALGLTEDGRFCFALEAPGAYLLGAAEDFVYEAADAAPIVVQPNLEIVFMAPAPKWEARLARFAERAGRGVGVLFRLTRPALQAAIGTGQDVEAVIAELQQASTQPLPPNVARQLRDWGGQVRRVRLQRAVLIRCPDPETAAQVRAKLGNRVREVSPTLLEADAPDRRAMTALAKQLRAAGVFVEES